MKIVNRLLVVAVIAFGSWFLVQQWDKVSPESSTETVDTVVTDVTEELTEEQVTDEETLSIFDEDPSNKPIRKVKPVSTTPRISSPPINNVVVDQVKEEVIVDRQPTSELTVYLFDGGFDLSRSSVPAGTITFNVRNDGRMPHQFAIEGVEDYGVIIPGGIVQSFTATLAAGEYELFSPRAVDQTLDMRETLAVENAG